MPFGLLLLGLRRQRSACRPLRRLADRLGIGRIVLLPLDERLDVGRRDQAHTMCPAWRSRAPSNARPHRPPSRRCMALRGQEGDKLRAGEASCGTAVPGSIGSMHLKHVLRDIQPDGGNLIHGRLLE